MRDRSFPRCTLGIFPREFSLLFGGHRVLFNTRGALRMDIPSWSHIQRENDHGHTDKHISLPHRNLHSRKGRLQRVSSPSLFSVMREDCPLAL
jgi:hypothetical protein